MADHAAQQHAGEMAARRGVGLHIPGVRQIERGDGGVDALVVGCRAGQRLFGGGGAQRPVGDAEEGEPHIVP